MHTEQHARTDEVAEKAFSCAPEQVGVARRWAAAVYRDAGADPDSCYLLVSEMATNAVVHARGEKFRIRIHREALWIEVWDESTSLPQQREHDEMAQDGRGLELLDLLTEEYEVVLGDTGNAICFQPKLGF